MNNFTNNHTIDLVIVIMCVEYDIWRSVAYMDFVCFNYDL